MRRDAGETLAEVVVTVAILGVAVATILGGLATVVNVSSRHRAQATAETLLVGAAERVKADGFTAACATPTVPDTTEVPRDTSVWTITVSAPTDAVTGGACSAATTVVQSVTVTVSGSHDASRSLDVLLRNAA